MIRKLILATAAYLGRRVLKRAAKKAVKSALAGREKSAQEKSETSAEQQKISN